MDPKPNDPNSAGADPDEFTNVRRRSRRVSFAETTAVHVFARDEDFETPPDSKPLNEGSKPEDSDELGFQDDHLDSGDSKGSAHEEEEEEDDDGEQGKFIRDMNLYSPGSTAGSVTSNDDDNFFGPVSASFINSGRLSETGMSEDSNHDITLDSTAFSLHFQNVVPPEDRSANSAGSLRTPTGDLVPTNATGFILSNGFTHHGHQNTFSGGKMSGNAGDSSIVSLIGDDPDSYGRYGKLSPTLDALLAETNKSMQPDSPISGSGTRTPRHDEYTTIVAKESAKDESHVSSMDATSLLDAACFEPNLSEGRPVGIEGDQNGSSIYSPNKEAGLPIVAMINEKTQVTFSPKRNGYSKDIHEAIQSNAMAKDVQSIDMVSPPYRKSSDKLTLQSGQVQQKLFRDQVKGNKHSLDPLVQSTPILSTSVNMDVQQQLLSEHGMQTPQTSMQPLQSPLPGSVSSLRSKRLQLFLDPSVLSQNKLMHTPDKEEPLSSLKLKLMQHGDRISAIKIPKSHKSPIITDSGSALSEKEPMPHELECPLEKNSDSYSAKHMGMPAPYEKDSPTDVAADTSARSIGVYLNHSESFTINNISVFRSPAKNEATETVISTAGDLLVQICQSEIRRKENLLTFDNPIERAPTLDVNGSSVGHATVKELNQIMDTLHNTTFSPIQMLGDKLSASEGGYFSPRVDRTTSLNFSPTRLQSPKSLTVPNFDEVGKLPNPKELVKIDTPLNEVQKQLEGSNYQDGNTVMTEFLVDRTNESPNSKMDGDKRMLDSMNLKESLPSKLTEDSGLNGQDLQSVQETYSSQTELSGKKRRIKQILLTDEDPLSEARRAQKSPKGLTDTSGKYSGHGVEGSNESVSIGGQGPQKHWKEIHSKISEATTQLFLPSICKLNSGELDILEDILRELQSAGKYERLLTSLRNYNSLGDHRRQRVAEARSLLDKLAYEKAKLQLKRYKLDKLSNKAHLCKSKLQECVKLKSIYSPLSVLDARNVQHGGSQLHYNSDNSAIDQVGYSKVTSMRQKLEMLDQKVNHMMKAFETSCKIKGTTSCDGVIKVVNDHLKMKNRCKSIQQDLQLWKLSDVVKKNDQCDVVLNYCNILCQRFTIQSRSVLSIVASNILDNARIEKVFESVFKAKEDRKFSSLKQLSQETLTAERLPPLNTETNLLLGNILDVLGEVQALRIQLWNLISSTFHLQRCRLDLKLSFLSFKNGWKVTLSLDLTILNCAGYPSKPSDFHIQVVETETTSPPSISDTIVNAVESLEIGRSMIIRLCQSISNVVRDSDGS